MTQNIENMLSAPDDEIRLEAVHFLRDIDVLGDVGKAADLLLRALKDTSWRVRKAAVETLVDEYKPESFLDKLVELLYDDDNAGARNAAIETFVRLGSVSVPTLQHSYESGDSDVRKFIIDIAGEVKHRDVVPLLIKSLGDSDDNVKASAVEHLSQYGEKAVVGELMDMLEKGELWTAYPAIEALGKIGDLRALPAIVDSLSERTLIEPALRALGHMDGDSVVAHIVPYLVDSSRSIRREAFLSLERLYSGGIGEDVVSESLYSVYGDGAVEMLLDTIEAGDEVTREPALVLMGALKDPRAIAPLLLSVRDGVSSEIISRALAHIGLSMPDALLGHFDEAMQDAAKARVYSVALADSAVPAYKDALYEMIGHDDGHVRANAARALGRIDGPESLEILLRTLHDPFIDVRENALASALALNHMVEPDAVDAIVKSPDADVRLLSVPLLARFGTPESLHTIVFLTKDSSPLVRKEAFLHLASHHEVGNIEYLINALADEDPDVKSSVAMRIGEEKIESMVENIGVLLSDSTDMVRVAACRSLGLLAKKETLPILENALSDPSGFVVASAVDAIACIGGDMARTLVEGMLGSRDREIVRSAIHALGQFDNGWAPVLGYLDSDDWATRYEAVSALARFLDVPEVIAAARDSFVREVDPAVRRLLSEMLDD